MQYFVDMLIVSAVVSGVLALSAGVKNSCRNYLRRRLRMG